MRFVRLVLVVWFGLTTFISSVVLYARSSLQQTNVQTLGFEKCGGQPCFRGIFPGSTTWDEAQRLLLQPGKQSGAFSGDVGHSRVSVRADAGDSLVELIDIIGDPNTPLPAVGAFVAQYGLPCGVSNHDNPAITVFLYPQMVFGVEHGQAPLTVDSPVVWFQLYKQHYWADHSDDLCSMYPRLFDVAAWQGFAAWRIYKANVVQP